MSSILKYLPENRLCLRLMAFGLSLCLVPAFMLGVVSVWSVIFAIIIGLRFRAGLIRLNEDIDRTENYSGIKYRPLFVALCLESMIYMAISTSVFYAAYVGPVLDWPRFTGFRFDDAVGFFDWIDVFAWIPGISLSDIASPYQSLELYTASTARMLALFVLVSLLAIAGRSWLGFDRRVLVRKWSYKFFHSGKLGLFIKSLPFFYYRFWTSCFSFFSIISFYFISKSFDFIFVDISKENFDLFSLYASSSFVFIICYILIKLFREFNLQK